MEKLLQIAGILLLCSISQSQGQFLPVLEWIQSFFGGYEEPPYFVNRTLGPDIEERTYPAQNWTCVEEYFTARKRDEKTPEMFMTLFSYIQGKNKQSRKIPMTIPVSTTVDHRNGDLNSYEMCFYLPSEFQEDPPVPNNPKIKIVTRPALHVYSRRYGGYSNEADEKEQMRNLTETLSKKNLKYFEEDQGPRAIHYINGYDAPTKFWSRRNEIWLLASNK